VTPTRELKLESRNFPPHFHVSHFLPHPPILRKNTMFTASLV